MLLIGSLSAIWAWWGKHFREPKCGSGHVCRVMAWTRQQGLVPYISFEKVRGDLSGGSYFSAEMQSVYSTAMEFLKIEYDIVLGWINYLQTRAHSSKLMLFFFNSVKYLSWLCQKHCCILSRSVSAWTSDYQVLFVTSFFPNICKYNIFRAIFKRDSIFPLLFVRPKIPLNYVLTKCTGWELQIYQLQELNHFLKMDDIKLLENNLKTNRRLWQIIGNIGSKRKWRENKKKVPQKRLVLQLCKYL